MLAENFSIGGRSAPGRRREEAAHQLGVAADPEFAVLRGLRLAVRHEQVEVAQRVALRRFLDAPRGDLVAIVFPATARPVDALVAAAADPVVISVSANGLGGAGE